MGSAHSTQTQADHSGTEEDGELGTGAGSTGAYEQRREVAADTTARAHGDWPAEADRRRLAGWRQRAGPREPGEARLRPREREEEGRRASRGERSLSGTGSGWEIGC